MWLWLAPIHPHPPPSTATAIHRHPPPSTPTATATLVWQAHWHITAAWLFLQAVVEERKKTANKQARNKKKSHHRKRIVSSVTTWVKHIACLFFLFFFLTFILAGRLWRPAISSCHPDENGCVRNENPLWRRNPWHLVLFPFFPPPFFISSPSLLLSARRCGVSAQWDHPSIKRVWAACGGFLPFNFLSMGFFFAGGALSLVCSGVCRCSWTHSSSGYSKQYDTKRPERLVLIYFQLCSLASAFKCPAFTLQFHQKSISFFNETGAKLLNNDSPKSSNHMGETKECLYLNFQSLVSYQRRRERQTITL